MTATSAPDRNPRQVPEDDPAGHFTAVSTGGALWLLDTGRVPDAAGPGRRGTVVLLHSAVGNSLTFRHQFGRLARSGLRVLAYDRRGLGRTPEAPPGAASHPSADLAALLEAEGISGPLHLVGAAAGGRLALDFSAAHPQRVASLTLVSSIAGLGAELYPAGTARLLPPEFLALPAYLRELGPVYRGEDPLGTDAWRALVESGGPVADGSDKAPGGGGRSSGPFPASTAGLGHLTRLAGEGGPGGTGIPVALITGDADPYVTPAGYRRLAEKIPGASLHIITEAGHSPYWERPGLFNDALLAVIHTTGKVSRA